MFKELLHSVSACGESMLCHNILSERQDSIPQRKIMFIDAKKTLIQSCENRNKNELPRECASCWLVTRHKYICFNFFPPSKSTFLKSQRMSKNLAWLYQSSNTRHIGGKKPYVWFMRTLRRTSVWSSTKKYVEGQASLERVEVAMGKCWTDTKKIKQKLTIVNGNLSGKWCPKDQFCHLKN